MKRAFHEVTLGGTFHAMHQGHQDYISLGASLADTLHFHLTSDNLAQSLKDYAVRPLGVRREMVSAYLRKIGGLDRTIFYAIDIQECLEAWVVNAEGLDVALVEPSYLDMFQRFNAQREERGLPPLCIVIKPRTKAGGVDISSSSRESQL